MKQHIKIALRWSRLTGWVAVCLAGQALAGWNGAGVAGGTGGVDINDPANWNGGIIDNDYSAITENADLQLTANHTVTNGLNFGTAAGAIHHLTFNGTKTLTLGEPQLSAFAGHVLLPANTLSTVTLAKGLTLNLDFEPGKNCYLIGAGQLAIDSLITGAGGFRLTASEGGVNLNLYLRNNANTFTGELSPSSGNIYFTSIADKDVPSALGAGNSIRYQTRNFIYFGTRDVHSDRRVMLYVRPKLGNDSACGSWVLTGDVLMGNGGYNNTISFGGISSGENLFEGSITDHRGDPTRPTKLIKTDSGSWRFTGMHTFSVSALAGADTISVLGGKLIADYVNDHDGDGSNYVFVAGHSVTMDDGHLIFKGKAGTGNTTYQAMGVCTLSRNTPTTLTVDSNGGDGTTVLLDGLESKDSNSLLLDLSENATLMMSHALPPDSGSVRLVNETVLFRDGVSSYMTIKDHEGKFGFPTQDDEQRIVLHTNTVAVTASNASQYNGQNLVLTGDVTRTDDLNFSTLVIDATENAVTLDMGDKRLQTDNTSVGRGILAYGAYPVTITNGAWGIQASSFIYNYGAGKLTLALASPNTFTVGGTGLTELITATNFRGYFYVHGGTARITTDMDWPGGRIHISGDGVLEIGADLNGEKEGDFTRDVSSSGDAVWFYGGGGFSAYGRDRVVNLGNDGRVVTWGVDYFVPTGKPFVLSSPHADSTLIFENPLGLSPQSQNYYIENAAREIRVHNGSADIDARLTGSISSGYMIVGIVKSGDGTLELTGTQDYLGSVSVVGGRLRLGADNIYHLGNELVLGNATLDGGTSHNVFDTLEILNDSTINMDDRSASLSFADSSDKLWTGTLTITGSLGSKMLRFGTDNQGLTKAQLKAITYGDGQKRLKLDELGYLVAAPGLCVIVR